MSKKFEFWMQIVAMVVTGITYILLGFSYAHSTFLTRVEADNRKENRDKTERLLFDYLGRIEAKVDKLLEQQR